MQEQGSPMPEQSAPILLASGPEDELAMKLLQTLRGAGLRAVSAENASIAALMVDEAAACVVVLRPDTWKAQAITTILRAQPACLIPVLAESMELPPGPWTEPALDLSTESEQGQQALLALLRARLATIAASRPPVAQVSELSPLPLRPHSRIRNWRINTNSLLSTLVLMALILGLGLFVGYRFTTTQTSTPTENVVISPTPSYAQYATDEPGPACDSDSEWELGAHYIKTVNGKPVEVQDTYTSEHCRDDDSGTELIRNGDYGTNSEIFFYGLPGDHGLAPHYLAQVDATFLSGDTQACLTFDVHVENSSYGRYSFTINAQGRWEANIDNNKDGSSISRMAIGFLPAVKRYTLGLEVNGPVMTFSINEAQVASVTDTAYNWNDALAFGISDATATTPISALFTNFRYEALPPLQPSDQQLMATETATAQKTQQAPYSAQVPGYGCDKAGAQWQSPAARNTPGELDCQADGMQLTEPANSNTIAEEGFYWFNGRFPQHYKVSVRIDVSAAGNGCAALGIHAHQTTSSYGTYEFVICPNGSWGIALITQAFHTLAHGAVDAQDAYTLAAELNGSTQGLYINGQLIQTTHNTDLTGTDHLSLDTGPYISDQKTSALFSNFTFTPLP